MKKIKEIITDIKLSLFLWLGNSLHFDEVDILTNDNDEVISVRFENSKLWDAWMREENDREMRWEAANS